MSSLPERRPAGGSLLGLIVGLVAGLGACAAPTPPGSLPAARAGSDLPVREHPLQVGFELLPDSGVLSESVLLNLLVRPLDGPPVELVSARSDGQPMLISLRARWQDYRGDGPVSSGRTAQVLLPWEGGGRADPLRPAEIQMRLEIAPAGNALARRLRIDGSLIGLEVLGPESRSGGQMLHIPVATLESFVERPQRGLEECLQSGEARSIFLRAASASQAERDQVLDTLIGSLFGLRGTARDAVFAALLFLTEERHGRDIQGWSAWWTEQQTKSR
ncbi:MAG: hypothetical protein ACT4PU_02325 [Planctomycetota bacterium]